jgi:hypothetical protein
MSRLCIDFGTSSIRAAISNQSSRRVVLPLGRAVKAKSSDEASLLSEIYINSSGSHIIFGERALHSKQRDLQNPYLINSPKLWLKEPTRLFDRAFTGLEITRAELLVGLLAFSIRASELAYQEIQRKHFDQSIDDVVIARPVWPDDIENELQDAVSIILSMAKKISREIRSDELKLSTLQKILRKPVKGPRYEQVVEPIAVAFELSSVEIDRRRLTLIVDIGAGTTDLGLFCHVETGTREDRIFPQPFICSEFAAGDLIDAALVDLLKRKSSVCDEVTEAGVRRRIRTVKETLFEVGEIFEFGVSVTLRELEETAELKSMTSVIKRAIQRVLNGNEQIIQDFTKASFSHFPYVEVLMAGGGNNLAFIRRAIEDTYETSPGKVRVQLKIVSPNVDQSIQRYGASIERLAVALGGADEGYVNLRTKLSSNLKVGANPLGEGKQRIELKTNAFSGNTAFNYSTPTLAVRQPAADIKTIQKQPKNNLKKWQELKEKSWEGLNWHSADSLYKYAALLLDYPNTQKSPYRNDALDFLRSSAMLGNSYAAVKLAELLSIESSNLSSVGDAYYWSLVASKLNQKPPDSHMLASIRGRLSAEVAKEKEEKANQFRAQSPEHLFSLKPSKSLSKAVSTNNVQKEGQAIIKGGTKNQRYERDSYGHRSQLSLQELAVILVLVNREKKLIPPKAEQMKSKELVSNWAAESDLDKAYFLAARLEPSFERTDLFQMHSEFEKVKKWLYYAKDKKL